MNAPSGIEQQFLLRASSTWRVFPEKRNTAMEENFQEIHTAPHHRPLAMTAAGIGRLPGAYFFTVPEGERTFPADGVNASPQRVFCAAAKPNLDEAACALDNTCEKCIQEEIQESSRKRGDHDRNCPPPVRAAKLRRDHRYGSWPDRTAGCVQNLGGGSRIRPWHWKMGPNTRFFCQRPFY